MIDVKDLQEGSLVLDRSGRLLQVRHIDGIGVATGFTLLGEKVASDTDNLQPVPITPGCLMKLGGHDLLGYLGRTCYGFCPEADGPMSPYMIHVEPYENVWVLHYDGVVLKELQGVHHLQALAWHLERVWITMQPYSHERATEAQ